MAGFFEAAEVIRKPPPSLLPKCGACGLSTAGCKSPKMPVTGEGRLGVLVVAEAPGEVEDDRNEQLVGPAGQLLREVLREIEVNLDVDCWKTNALICRPPENRTPTADEIDYCRPNLMATIRELRPKVIIPMGGPAIKSLLAPFWREDVGSVSTWVGWRIPLQKPNVWIAPTYHPSHVRREIKDETATASVLRLWFKRHLQSAFELSGSRPWPTVPDFLSQVRVEYDPEAAARWIRSVVQRGGPTSFDYETDRLKPDMSDSEIVSCAITWRGLETVAYPWAGEAIKATSEYLQSDLPKIGANLKFEDRWTRAKLGHRVNKGVWDGMLSAHHLDQRWNITSVKFQAFVRLGQEPWDLQVRPYLEADGGNAKNRIRQLDLRTLLIYNGMDPLMEYHVGGLQRAEMLQQDTEVIRLGTVR